MVKVLVILLLSAWEIRGEYKVDIRTVNKRTIQDKVDKGKPITTESRASDNIIALHGEFNGTKSLLEYNLNFSLVKRFNDKEYTDILYLGENSYLLLPIKNTQFIFGRKLFSESPHTITNWKDGIEGFGAESQVSDKLRFHFYLVDFFRGYPLFEKYFLFKNKEGMEKGGERFRHGLSFVFQEKNLYSKLHFTYLNLGNWGNGTKDDLRSQPKGDSDFLYTGNFTITNRNKYFSVGLELHFVRGLDKTQSNSNRKEKSIPVSGELARIYFESYLKIFQTRLELFIPDSDKRNAQSEILESGFIGFGSYPGSAFLLNQELNFYPSGWVTPAGLEKQDSIYNGRRNSFWVHLLLSARLGSAFFILEGDHLTPRNSLGASTGNISLDKKDYDKSFLFEVTGSILYDMRNLEGFFIRFNISKLYTSKDILIDGTSAYLQGGLKF